VKAGDAELHAYVDGALDAETRRAVEAHLAQHPGDQARVDAYLAQRRALHERYDAVLDEPIPETLKFAAAAARTRPRYGLAAGWLLAGIAVGWFAAHALSVPQASVASLPRQAAIAHAVYTPEVRHPVEVGADQQEHLVRWLSKRLGTNLKAPLLTREGYELVGGRLLPGGQGGPVAQFMYQDAKGRRLTLYVSRVVRDEGDTAFRYSREDDVSVFYWIDGTVAYALSGAMSREDLLAVANVVYKQLNP
jgi:anti-sigma factor RsiW